MGKRGFTDKERRTIYGLLRFPTLNDRELAEVIDLNISTVTAIRRRLTRSGLVHSIEVPNVYYLGAELMTIGYGRISSTQQADVVSRINSEIIAPDPSIFLSGFSKDHGFIMAYHKNYTDAKVTMERLECFFNENRLYDGERWTFVLFPLELSKMLNNFNYASLFKRRFEMEGIPFELDLEFESRKRDNLTEKEKEVLIGLVTYPNLPDKAIADKVGASRQAVSKIKKRFYRQRILDVVTMLDCSKLDFEILALVHSKFNPTAPLSQRKTGVEMMLNDVPQIMMISGNYENVLLGTFLTYHEYNEVRNEVVKFYKKSNFMQTEPRSILFPYKDLIFLKKHDYMGVCRYLLGDGDLRYLIKD